VNVLHIDEQTGWRGGEQQVHYLIRGLAQFVIDRILGLVNNIVNMFIDLINTVISLLDILPGVNLDKIANIHLKYEIPEFAAGGIFNKATLGIIGEAGPEAVVPLSRMGGIAAGMGQTIIENHFHIAGSVIAENQLVTLVRESFMDIQRYSRTTGIA